MEGSVDHSSVMNRTSFVEDEESGWTAYFEDFSDQKRGEEEEEDQDSFCTSSMVSDAASFVPAWNKSATFTTCRNYSNHLDVPSSSIGGAVAFNSQNIPKKLTFKQTRAKEISHDDSLEDTASSPVNSPKVSDNYMNPRKTIDHFNNGSLGKDERCEMSCSGNNDYKDLKKRGLCLVPLSMLVNYLG